MRAIGKLCVLQWANDAPLLDLDAVPFNQRGNDDYRILISMWCIRNHNERLTGSGARECMCGQTDMGDGWSRLHQRSGSDVESEGEHGGERTEIAHSGRFV